MGGFGSFYKGEKKKKKKGDSSGASLSFAPTFVPPVVLPKGKEKKF